MGYFNVVADLSHWQYYIDYAALKAAGILKGVVVKCSQGKSVDTLFDTHAMGFIDQRMPTAAYHWFDPYVDLKLQLDLIRSQTSKYPAIQAVMIDAEQFGWTSSNLVPYKDPLWLSINLLAMVTGIQTMGLDVMLYSRTALVMERFKYLVVSEPNNQASTNWLYRPELNIIKWMASYPFGNTVVTCTWGELMTSWAPKVFSPYIASTWPTSYRYFDAWQWSGDKFVLPYFKNSAGGATAIDLNYFSDEALARFTEPAAPPSPDYKALLETVYYELVDLKAHDVKELDYIMGLIKPGG